MEMKESQPYRWLDFRSLAKSFLRAREELGDVYFFTALATWNQGKVKRHRIYISALESTGVTIVMGKFKQKDVRCRADCKKMFLKREEKQTDVNIAVHLLRDAFIGAYDRAILITGDTDIIPAIAAVQKNCLKQVGVILPFGRRSEELKNRCDFYHRMKLKHLAANQLPLSIDAGRLGMLTKPESW